MREISVKALRASISKELMNLPFAISMRGKVVAQVYTSGSSVHRKDGLKCTPNTKCTPVECTPDDVSVHLPTEIIATVKAIEAQPKPKRTWSDPRTRSARRTKGEPEQKHLPGDVCSKHGVTYGVCGCSLNE